MESTVAPKAQTPWHLWAVGIISLCWNGFGAYDYLMTVTHDANWLAKFPPGAIAIVDAFPAWAVAAWAAGVWVSVLGSLLLLIRSRAAPAEPTRSLGAMALVLFAGQITDAARFFVLALAVATGAPVLAAMGGALGSGAVLTAAWALGGGWERLPLRAIRLASSGAFLIAAVAVALSARGVIG